VQVSRICEEIRITSLPCRVMHKFAFNIKSGTFIISKRHLPDHPDCPDSKVFEDESSPFQRKPYKHQIISSTREMKYFMAGDSLLWE